MNRRSFLAALSKAVPCFTILPGAGRIWKAERRIDMKKFFDDLYALNLARKREAQFLAEGGIAPLQCASIWYENSPYAVRAIWNPSPEFKQYVETLLEDRVPVDPAWEKHPMQNQSAPVIVRP